MSPAVVSMTIHDVDHYGDEYRERIIAIEPIVRQWAIKNGCIGR